MNRSRLRGWSIYSWANHGWETTVSTVLIGPWLLALATQGRADSATLIAVFGLRLRAESLPSATVTVAALVQLLCLPPLGVIADRRRLAGRLLRAACIAGSVIAILLAATSGGEWIAAGVLFIGGSLAYGASNLFYNSYLPRIATPAERDSVSSRGFVFGYVGGGLLLAANLLLLLLHGDIGLAKAVAVRICFVSAGAWWLGFGLWSLPDLVGGRSTEVAPPRAHVSAWRELGRELRALRRQGSAGRYLAAYLLFSDAISAVIGLSSTFITHELFGDSASRASTFLFALILLIQFVAVAGAAGFARLAARFGAKSTLLGSLVAWCLIILFAYFVLRSKLTAVIAGVAIGLVLGGSQALARSLWSQFIPAGREATFFSLFEVANEGTAWIAPLLFTIVVNATGSFRQAILSLLILFVAGGAVLLTVDESEARPRAVPAS